ncbi:MAG: pyruvate, phosphate dikinase [Deltaproteobacteria bacterium]|nr:pyruvate, phosphate dikinase [Deltaproteobacteria bacterium]
MSKYYGITEGLNVFLTELCHPYKNWGFIVKEARGYALDYFHLLNGHPKGREAANLYIDIFLDAIDNSQNSDVQTDATDNLLVFMQKIIRDSGKGLNRLLSSLCYGFDKILSLGEERFLLFVQSFYQINKLAIMLHGKNPPQEIYLSLNSLLARYLRCSYSYWLGEMDPFEWFMSEVSYHGVRSEDFERIFHPVTHHSLTNWHNELESALKANELDPIALLEGLTKLPGYRQIVETYREIPQKLLKAESDTGQGMYWKLVFLFRIMNCTGLYSIHEETLRDINRTLAWLINNTKPEHLEILIRKTFTILYQTVGKYPATALSCVDNMGKAIYKTDDSDLVVSFIESVVNLGFQTPDLKGIGDDWQMRVNSSHIKNIRTWMEIIEINPKWSKKLLSSLIIYLSLGGVYIKDTDLFPRDVTALLNSDIAPVYNLVKQLSRLFPTFFNDIGAEGQLRDISTKIDEISHRKDVLVHFLRKQSHVESSNQIINLMEATIEFWRTKDKKVLKPFVPLSIFSQIETEGQYIEGVYKIISRLFSKDKINRVSDLLKLDREVLPEVIFEAPGVSEVDRERVDLAITFYRLIYQKYNLGHLELRNYIKQIKPMAFPEMDRLQLVLDETDGRQKLIRLLAYLEKLKEIILSPEKYEIREDIYHKRHFTVDIPSMYGSYHEMKFDALGLTFRIESLVNVLFEELVEEVELELITRDTFSHIYDNLQLFYEALKLDGILSAEMESQMDLLARALGVRDFSFTQFLDVFRGISNAVRNIVNDYFNNIHEPNLINILNLMEPMSLLPKYRSVEPDIEKEKLIHRVTEVFLRDRISTSLGLQQLDLFLSRVMKTLFRQSDKLPSEGLRQLLNYHPNRAITPLNPVNSSVSGVIYLGNKGLNLVRLSRYGFPVPPGFIITTEVFRCKEVIDRYKPAEKNLEDQIASEISTLESITGKSFGKPDNPLLLSVRSGSPISQPGMMDTFLNVGINEDIVEGIIKLTGQEWFAWDCFRRFLQSYGMIFGLTRDDFDDIIARFKAKLGIPYKKDFSGKQMKRIALAYRDFIRENGITIEVSPLDQLYITIKKVFESWNTSKAKTYRKIMQISDDWGTAVAVQAMVFGNLSQQSGSGVVFTHSPRWSGDMVNLWGDFTLENQGEDVVSGLVKTLPISRKQAEEENREGETTLEVHFPELYQSIRNLAKDLIYNRKWGPQEMEFTFESPQKKDLYFLQTRDMAIRERKKVLSFAATPDSESRRIAHGIGVSGGAMTGRVVFNLQELQKWRKEEKDTSLILVRGDTVPDDIREIYGADGLLTARGGSTSHAAIVAHRLGKTCVVGCANLICNEKESSCSLDGVRLNSGDWVSIDGREGSVYQGKMDIEEFARR